MFEGWVYVRFTGIHLCLRDGFYVRFTGIHLCLRDGFYAVLSLIHFDPFSIWEEM